MVSDAKSAATLSTLGFAVGLAGVAGATVLWLTAPSKPGEASTQVGLTPVAAPSAAGLFMCGRF